MEFIGGMGEIISALLSGDSFELQTALRGNAGLWPLGLIITLVGGALVAFIYRAVPFIERNLEPAVMIVAYLAIGYIIFAGVVQRFYLSGQPAWSTTLPPFLFLIMTWVGCSYNVKLRTHLAFSEFRKALPRTGQMLCLMLDAVLWIGFAWIVVVTTFQETVRAAANFAIMLGTDNVMQWWFLGTVPVAFILLVARVLENVSRDVRVYREGGEMIEQAVIGGDA
ncbi:TRAP transporter small permease [Roseovarius rhodophyticola]|uniref:TRAP transporter small permease protein n=1 Tax=Roseovarius rhodophyticola TaxID=3080827 RepID=A0ABZ2TNV9_9RHOB|nr:TRAP transporter small permease subunit [Roseovarius sp. W115]MDV2930189.1 TRAP transporter small permease subunit [Roseovarius sp. W115]